MIRQALILSASLSAAALGPLLFQGGPVSDMLGGSTAWAKEDPAEFSAPANNLRNLLEVAGRKGLIDLRSQANQVEEAAVTDAAAEAQDEASNIVDWPVEPADCIALSPLFDGGQGDFAIGVFTELSVDEPSSAELALALSELIDPSYAGQPLPIDLRLAADCGPSFLPWQALADPATLLDAETEIELTWALNNMQPVLRRQLGVQIATRAGVAGNLRLTRRIADTLTDAGLHGQLRHNGEAEHVLLDAILKISRDPVGARARLAWIAERDGPEQFIAIDLLKTLDAVPMAKAELSRLSDSPDSELRLSAQQRLLATAIDDADIELVLELVSTANNLSQDDGHRIRLAEKLSDALESDDPLRAVQALDVIARLETSGVPFDPSLTRKAEARLATLTRSDAGAPDLAFTSTLTNVEAPGQLNGPVLSEYLGQVDADLTAFQEVLSRG